MKKQTPDDDGLHIERRLHTRHRARTTVYITVGSRSNSRSRSTSAP
jgi:hypothetical protein